MKIAWASDLHVEFKEHKVPEVPEGTDVLVLAGDISSNGKGLQWAWETYGDKVKHLVVVYGNHDYWSTKHSFQKIIRQAREYAADKPTLHFLENDAICIDGVWFIGGTCWTDFELGPNSRDLNIWMARQGMNDYVRIKWHAEPQDQYKQKLPGDYSGSYRKLRPDDIHLINYYTKKFIFGKLKEIRENDASAVTVVVTHHGPTELSLDPAYSGSNLNPCYVSPWGNLIADEGPHCWIHGHVHQDKAYKVNNTVVLCNPIGYPGQIPGSKIKALEIKVVDEEASTE